ncbi:MAG: hypothetical protein F7C34_05140 [Desulfurococcales archaeon]|nr:hypothetical protein [Desulfurococcales archaeon]
MRGGASLIIVLAALLIVAHAQPTSTMISGEIEKATLVSGEDVVLINNIVAKPGDSVLEIRDAEKVLLGGDIVLPPASTLTIRIESAREVEVSGLRVQGSEGGALLILEVLQCFRLNTVNVSVMNATIAFYAVGCARTDLRDIRDPLRTSTIHVSGAAVANISGATAGAILAGGVGALRVVDSRTYTLVGQAEAYLEMLNVSSRKAKLLGSSLMPLVRAEYLSAGKAEIYSAGLTILRSARLGSLSINSTHLAIMGSSIDRLRGSSERVLIRSSSIGPINLRGTTALAVEETNVTSYEGDAIDLSGPLSSIAIVNSTLVAHGPGWVYAVDINRSAPPQQSQPGPGGEAPQPENPLPGSAAAAGLNITIIGSYLWTGSAAVRVSYPDGHVRLGVARTILVGEGLLSAAGSTSDVLVIESEIYQMSGGSTGLDRTQSLIISRGGNITIVSSQVKLGNPFIVKTTQGGKATLVLARNVVKAPSDIADEMAKVSIAGVTLKFCLDEQKECSCGNEYSASFLLGRDHPIIYGVEDTHNGGYCVPQGCKVDPLSVAAVIDKRYSAAGMTGGLTIHISVVPKWAIVGFIPPAEPGQAGAPAGGASPVLGTGYVKARIFEAGERVAVVGTVATVTVAGTTKPVSLKIWLPLPAHDVAIVRLDNGTTISMPLHADGSIETVRSAGASPESQVPGATRLCAAAGTPLLVNWIQKCSQGAPPVSATIEGSPPWAALVIVAHYYEPAWGLLILQPGAGENLSAAATSGGATQSTLTTLLIASAAIAAAIATAIGGARAVRQG